MTSTPSLPAQIEAVRDTIMAGERVRLTMKLSPLTDWNQDCLRAVLVTLQQHERDTEDQAQSIRQEKAEVARLTAKHERLEAVVKAARRYFEASDAGEEDAVCGGLYWLLRAALDATAPETPTDTGPTNPKMPSEV